MNSPDVIGWIAVAKEKLADIAVAEQNVLRKRYELASVFRNISDSPRGRGGSVGRPPVLYKVLTTGLLALRRLRFAPTHVSRFLIFADYHFTDHSRMGDRAPVRVKQRCVSCAMRVRCSFIRLVASDNHLL